MEHRWTISEIIMSLAGISCGKQNAWWVVEKYFLKVSGGRAAIRQRLSIV
jgi:hypothetical protein